MSQPYVVGQPQGQGRSPWFWVAIIGGGCLLALLITCGIMAALGVGTAWFLGDKIEEAAKPSYSWTDAAARTSMDMYEPGYLPENSGTVEIFVFGIGEIFQTASGTYTSGLKVEQTNRNTTPDTTGVSEQVNGADEAYWTSTANGRALAIRRGETWVQISGVSPDSELIRIGESLQLVEG